MSANVDFIFLGSKITAGGDCSHEIKRRLLLGKKVMTNLDSIFKSRDITLPTKVHLVKAMVFPVVMYGCESWTVKKDEHWRIDTFELWCWRRLPRVPWTARRSNQSILKEISPGISLEWMTLKLKPQYFGHLMRRVDSLQRTLMLGGIGAEGEGDYRGWDGWIAPLTRWTLVWVNSRSWWWTGRPGVLQFMGSQRVGHDWATELNWCTIALYSIRPCFYHQSHPLLGVVFAFAHPSILSGIISPLISSSILGTYQPEEFIFQCPIFLPFHTVHGVLKARNLKWFAIPFSSGPHSVRTLHRDLSIFGDSTWHGTVSLS